MNFEQYAELKVGDYVYKITDVGIVKMKIISDIGYGFKLENGYRLYVSCHNLSRCKVYFTSEEEAKEYVRVQKANKIKKQKLYELEKQLNEEYNINTFFIKI